MTLSWRHNAFSSLFGTRDRFTWWTRVSYLWLKKKGGERGKVASALRWNVDTEILVLTNNCFLTGCDNSAQSLLQTDALSRLLIFKWSLSDLLTPLHRDTVLATWFCFIQSQWHDLNSFWRTINSKIMQFYNFRKKSFETQSLGTFCCKSVQENLKEV